MLNLLSRSFLILFLVLFSHHAMGQYKPTEKIKYAGKDFWVALNGSSTFNDFYITSAHQATVTFTYSENNTSQAYTVQPGTTVKVPVTTAQMILLKASTIEVVQSKSLHIAADSDIVVHYVSWGNHSDDGTIVYPSDRQQFGDLFFLNTMRFLPENNYFGDEAGSFSIVATCDNVTLEITPTKKTATHTNNVPFTVLLNKGQTYTIANRGTNFQKDLSGTRVEIKSASCCNPINIFNTSICQYSYWPYDTSVAFIACDNLLEQILPVSVWDTIHHVVPSLNNPYNIIKIVSAGDNNIISFDGLPVTILNEGATMDTIIRKPVIIQSSAPVGINQFMLSLGVLHGTATIFEELLPPDSLTDPNEAWVLPLRDGLTNAYFNTVGQSYNDLGVPFRYNKLHVLTIISKADNINSITLNDVALAAQFLPFPGDASYMYANITADTGVYYHLISSEKVIAYYYAATLAGSINFHLGNIEPAIFYDELRTDTIVACNGSTNLLEGGEGFSFVWSTGEATQNISVTDTGLYYVIKHNNDDCIGKLKRFIIVRPPTYLQHLDLGADTIICEGKTIVLHGQGPLTSWSTGQMANTITVSEPGSYWATLTDSCTGFVVTDTIVVMDTLCPGLYCDFNFPNAFSPNSDGLNDILQPVYYGELNQYSLSIYNRLGQRVFYSAKIEHGWNGNIKGAPADVGVYFYQCGFYCPLRGYIETKGDITLIR